MRTAIACTLLVFAGCGGKSPCADHKSSSCIEAKITGDVGRLDQLRFTADVSSNGPQTTPTTPKAFDLPVEVALEFPAAEAGQAAHLVVEGLRGGVALASDSTTVTLPAPATPVKVTLELVAPDGGADGGFDGGTTDGGGDLVATPSPLAFSATYVGHAPAAFVTLQNTTATSLSLGTPALAGDAVFQLFDASAIDTQACAAMNATVAANASCRLYLSFVPQQVGPASATLTVPYDGGAQSLSVEITGTGKALVFSNESQTSSGVNFVAVHGDSPDHIYVVGDNAQTCLFAWDGTAWTSRCAGIDTPLTTVYALDAMHLWTAGIATAQGIYVSADRAMTWATQPLMGSDTTGHVTDIQALSATSVFALETGTATAKTALLFSADGKSWQTSPTSFAFSADALANNGGALMIAGDGGQVAFAMPAGQSFAAAYHPTGISSTVAIPDAWGAPGGRFYLVTQDDGTNPKWGVFSLAASDTTAQMEYALSDASEYLTAIAGRTLPGGQLEIFAVGGLGATMLHGVTDTNGAFVWTTEQLPTADPLNAVFVAPNGDVVAVGANGRLLHFH